MRLRNLAIFVFLASMCVFAHAEEKELLCGVGESVSFSCRIGAKMVSLCVTRKGDAVETLLYRYGTPRRIEKEYVANHENSNRFLAAEMPASPRASVKQVWFTQNNFKYLLSECSGGDCPKRAGLAVFRGNKILMNASCAKEDPLAAFSSDLTDFRQTTNSSEPKTDLLRVEEYDNRLDKLYPVKKVY